MQYQTARRLLASIAVFAILVVFVWFQWELVCIVFAGGLLAILLHACAIWLARHSPFGPKLSYAIILLAICAIVVVAALLIAPRAIGEGSEIAASLPGSIHKATAYLQRQSWGRTALRVLHQASSGTSTGPKLTSIAMKFLSGLADLVVILVVGFFGAVNPGLYRRGLLALAPPQRRDELGETLDRIVVVLRWWILGQMVPMSFLAVASMVSLWLLGVKLAFALGLFTGLMVFIPYVGSVIAGIPSILMALQGGRRLALEVFVLYVLFHLLEGYILTPLVQKKAVRLPPALTILTQLFFWDFGGVLAVAIAAPATAAAIVAVQRLYLRKQDAGAASNGA